MDSVINTCELLLNVVIESKPKALIGLSQKVSGQAQRVFVLLTQTLTHRRKDSI